MATKTKKKPRPKREPRPKQQLITDDFAPSVPALDDAADNYYEVMIDRCKLSKEEDEKKTALIEKMKEHGLDRYETKDGLVVTVTDKTNIKCKKKKDDSNGDGE